MFTIKNGRKLNYQLITFAKINIKHIKGKKGNKNLKKDRNVVIARKQSMINILNVKNAQLIKEELSVKRVNTQDLKTQLFI